MSIADRATRHHKTLCDTPFTINIPEWVDDEGNDTLLYFKPLTLKEQDQFTRLAKGNENDYGLHLLIRKAFTDDSCTAKAFDLKDFNRLKCGADSQVINRILGELITAYKIGDIIEEEEDAEGN